MNIWDDIEPECPRERVAEMVAHARSNGGQYSPLDAMEIAERRADHKSYRTISRAWVTLFSDTDRAMRWLVPPGRSRRADRWIEYARGLHAIYGAEKASDVAKALREAARRQNTSMALISIAGFGWLELFGDTCAAEFETCMTMAEEWNECTADWVRCAQTWGDFPGDRFVPRIERCLKMVAKDSVAEKNTAHYWLTLANGWITAFKGKRSVEAQRCFAAAVARARDVADWASVGQSVFNIWPEHMTKLRAYMSRAEALATKEEDWLVIAEAWDWIEFECEAERCYLEAKKHAEAAGRVPKCRRPWMSTVAGCPHCNDGKLVRKWVDEARAVHATNPSEARRVLEVAETAVDPEPARMIMATWRDVFGDREQAKLWETVAAVSPT